MCLVRAPAHLNVSVSVLEGGGRRRREGGKRRREERGDEKKRGVSCFTAMCMS